MKIIIVIHHIINLIVLVNYGEIKIIIIMKIINIEIIMSIIDIILILIIINHNGEIKTMFHMNNNISKVMIIIV
jgi:hypothetical protein